MTTARMQRNAGQPGDYPPLLLNYQIFTQPQPLQISPGSDPVTGTINIVVSKPEPSSSVYCDTIEIAVPVGPDQGCLYAQTPRKGVSTKKWLPSSMEIFDGTTLGLGAGSYATFIFNARDPGDYDITYGLVFLLTGFVNNVVGNCNILIQEWSSTDNPPDFQPHRGTFTVALAPSKLYLTNFVATRTGSPTVPCTQFANGEDINLAWESNGTGFQLYKKNCAKPFYHDSATTCTLAGGVATDTTLFLVASLETPTGRGPEKTSLYDALTISIGNPSLTPNTLVSTWDIKVGGALTVHGAASVSGRSTLAAVEAASLNLTGAATLGATKVDGLSASTIGDDRTLWECTVAMLSAAQVIDRGRFQALTDGFCLGTTAADWNIRGGGFYQISASSQGVTMYATGADALDRGVQTSLCLPVRSGQNWTCDVEMVKLGPHATYQFYWVPFGTALPRDQTFKWLGDAAATPPHLAATEPVGSISRRNGTLLDELVNLIGLLFPEPIPPETRQRLAGLLRMLNAGM